MGEYLTSLVYTTWSSSTYDRVIQEQHGHKVDTLTVLLVHLLTESSDPLASRLNEAQASRF